MVFMKSLRLELLDDPLFMLGFKSKFTKIIKLILYQNQSQSSKIKKMLNSKKLQRLPLLQLLESHEESIF
jgi:transcription termination factor NusB